MGRRTSWHRRAEEDLTEAYLHIGTDSPAAAERLLEAVEETIAFLLESPSAGRRREWCSPHLRGVRSWRVNGFRAYLIFYRVEEDGLRIVRLLHGARDIRRHLEDGI